MGQRMIHILNGDAVLSPFRASKLSGASMVCREIFCQGPLHFTIDSDLFSRSRAEFLQHYLGRFYSEKTTSWEKERDRILRSLRTTQEVVLWFEYDLFCQVNMMTCINLMRQANYQGHISLVQVGRQRNSEQWFTLSHPKLDWPELFRQRTKLTASELEFCERFWQMYTGDDHLQLDGLMHDCPPVLKYLPLAIENHYRRFPSRKDGLTDIQRHVFEKLSQNKEYLPEDLLIRDLLRTFHYYGYGDLQYRAILHGLRPLLDLDDMRGWCIAPDVNPKNLKQSYLPTITYGGVNNHRYWLEDLIGEE